MRVGILTNSFAATDVVAVHAGYAQRRWVLLEAGVELFELKTSAVTDDPKEKLKIGLSTSSSLHAKTFAVDDTIVFVGSFNVDQRSLWLNTEMGLLVKSAPLARKIEKAFEDTIPKIGYEVRRGTRMDRSHTEWSDALPYRAGRRPVAAGIRTVSVDTADRMASVNGQA